MFKTTADVCTGPLPWFEAVHHTSLHNWAVESYADRRLVDDDQVLDKALYVGTGDDEEPSTTGATVLRQNPGRPLEQQWAVIKTWATLVPHEGVSALSAQGDLQLYVGLGLRDGFLYTNCWEEPNWADGRAEVWRTSEQRLYALPPDEAFERISPDDTGQAGPFGGGVQCLYVLGSCNDPVQDTDGDGDVDVADYGQFLACYNGPNRRWPAPPVNQSACGCMDKDDDGDVDLMDYAAFQVCYNGPNRPAACPRTVWICPAQGVTGGRQEAPHVLFDLQSPRNGQTILAGMPVEWNAVVNPATAGLELAGYAFELELLAGSETGRQADAALRVDQYWPALCDQSAPWKQGGEGASTRGRFIIGDALTVPGPGLGATTGLATDGTGGAVVSGTIETAGLVPGHYLLVLRDAAANVLRRDVDLRKDTIGNFAVPAEAVKGVDRIKFDVVGQ